MSALPKVADLDLVGLLEDIERAPTARRVARALTRLVDDLGPHPMAESADGQRVLQWATEQMGHHVAAYRAAPLAYAEPWAPRCNTCGRWDPKAGELDAPEMVWTGEGLIHECPCCGVREARTSQRLALRLALTENADYVFILGGNRCVGGETPVRMADGTTKRMDAVQVGEVVATPDGPVAVTYTVRKGPDPMLRVFLGNGLAFRGTPWHRVRSASGEWVQLADVRKGTRLEGEGSEVVVMGVYRCGMDYHYDVTVPGPHCYQAAGIVHHNTGKSEGAAQLCDAVTQGRDDPAVVEWVRSLGLDMADIPMRKLPRGPGLSYAIALTSHDSLQYVRPKLARYLPAGTHYRAWTSNQQAEARTPDGAKVVCKSVDQGRRAMQGAAARFVWPDEEIDGAEAIEIMEELDARLTDANGWMALSMTPLKGWTPMLTKFVKNARPDVLVTHLNVLDNPYIERASVAKRLARYGERIRLARERGTITALEGAVHPSFDRAVHVVPSFDPPEDWPRFGGIDFGVRDPFVHLWVALAPDEVVHVYREHYRRDERLKDHARAIWQVEGCPDCMPADFGSDAWHGWTVRTALGEQECGTCGGSGLRGPEPHVRWADAAGLDQRRTLAGEYAISTTESPKDRDAGFNAIDEALQLDVEGRPHLVIHDCCLDTIREMEGLRWDEKRKAETATVGDDHAWDTLRYVVLGMRRAGYLTPAPDLTDD